MLRGSDRAHAEGEEGGREGRQEKCWGNRREKTLCSFIVLIRGLISLLLGADENDASGGSTAVADGDSCDAGGTRK